MGGAWSRAALRERFATLPRVPLVDGPTPLQECPRLTEALGGPRILVKRDDLTGLALGGNKTRKLELYLAELLDAGDEMLVTGAAVGSNFCRQAAAAAARLGLRARLILMGDPATPPQGNLLLDDLLGAEVDIRPLAGWAELHAAIESEAARLRDEGVRARAVTGFEPLGSAAYLGATLELLDQCDAAGVMPDRIYLSSATGTQAGIVAAVRALGLPTQVVGVAAASGFDGQPSIPARLAAVATWIAERLDLGFAVAPEEIVNTTAYVGEAYGRLTVEAAAAIRLAGATEGLLLDPVYTGKAMAGLVDHVRTGRIGAGEVVVFVHTGGAPGIFAQAEALAGFAREAVA